MLALLVLCDATTTLLAQQVDCARLQAAIRASESDSGQRDDSGFSRAAEQQRREIDRTRRYAAQLGCGESQSGFFGNAEAPECGDIEDRLARMQDNLARMQDQASQARSDDRAGRQSAMIARYNALCVGNPSTLSQSSGTDPGYLPNDGRSPADLTTVPMNPDDLSTVPLNGDIMQDGGDTNHNLGHAICVRTCDGGYFPLAAHVSTDQVDQLDNLCKASCPNTEAHLYTMRGDGLTEATAVDGTSYTALPTAFKFEKTYSPTCTCKPPNQSWAQALEGAEKLLTTGDRHDVTVTAALSDQMAKPVAAPAIGGKGKAARDKAGATATAVPVTADKRVVAEAQRGAQAPTASNESAGIGGQARSEKVLGPSDGLRITVDGPDGVRKRIRLIVP